MFALWRNRKEDRNGSTNQVAFFSDLERLNVPTTSNTKNKLYFNERIVWISCCLMNGMDKIKWNHQSRPYLVEDPLQSSWLDELFLHEILYKFSHFSSQMNHTQVRGGRGVSNWSKCIRRNRGQGTCIQPRIICGRQPLFSAFGLWGCCEWSVWVLSCVSGRYRSDKGKDTVDTVRLQNRHKTGMWTSQSTWNPEEKSKHFTIYAYSKFQADQSFLLGMYQGYNVEVNLREEAAAAEKNAFEHFIDWISC